jgi:peptidoglycan/LPS O-acetylase OafA/YrhL
LETYAVAVDQTIRPLTLIDHYGKPHEDAGIVKMAGSPFGKAAAGGKVGDFLGHTRPENQKLKERCMESGHVTRPVRSYQYRYFGIFRLLLAGLVMFQHFAADLAPARLADAMMPYPVGNLAVLVFFSLSGFVITEAADCVYRDRAVAFLANRLLRIMPHFVLAVALSMLAHETFLLAEGERLWRSQPSFPADIGFAPRNILLNFVGALPLSNKLIDYNFLDIAWAVRVEIVFYLAIFLAVLLGRTRLGARRFGWILGCMLVLVAPLFVVTVTRGDNALMYAPYFAFGSALYFAISRCHWGLLVIMLSIPAMLSQYLLNPLTVPLPDAPPVSLWGNLAILATLMSMLTILSVVGVPKLRRTDQVLGSFTYPL